MGVYGFSTMSVVDGKKFIPYNAAPPEALATISSFDEYLGFGRVI